MRTFAFLPEVRIGTVEYTTRPVENARFIGFDMENDQWMYLTEDGSVAWADSYWVRVSPLAEEVPA